MAKINHHFQKLQGAYLFPEIERRIELLKQAKEGTDLLNLGIGDVTFPLFPNVVKALQEASEEMGDHKSLKGYGPSSGYLFLKEAIAKNDYQDLFSPDEIFISDGINTDISNIQEIFAIDNRIAILDPAYPVYADINVMAGRTRPILKAGGYGSITYLSCTEQNNFQPDLPMGHVDLIYLCSPNNPTGVSLSKECLKKFVDYAKKHEAVILFDGAYESFITSDAPRSIYEIEGAKEVAIEFRSFSKSAGFTGLRCSYTVIPHALKVKDAGAIHSLHSLWKRRVDTKSNGVSYPVQKAALSLYTEEGKKAVLQNVQETNQKGQELLKGLQSLGYTVYGGIDSPYVWCKTPPKVSSWEFFDFILNKAHIITVPGSGFGKGGEGFIRLSAFAKSSSITQALTKLKELA